VVTGQAPDTEPAAERHGPPPPIVDGGDISRMTLRMVEQIKAQAEQAASAQGVSLNTFISQAVQGALHGASKAHGHETGKPRAGKSTDSHLHGWVRG